MNPVQIVGLYLSPGHNYFGHHGRDPGTHRLLTPDSVHCVAERGIVGDRFFDHKENYKGQITFFEWEVYEQLRISLGVKGRHPGVFRRNAVTFGVRLNDLVGAVFEIQGVRFEGVAECSPCYWMDRAFGPGAEEALKGRGGLRARILTNGVLRVDCAPPVAVHAA